MIIGRAVIPGKQKPIAPPAPVVQEISFFIDNTEHHADEGMTWADWVNSEYNYIGARLGYPTILNSAGTYRIAQNNSYVVVGDDTIIENYYYIWQYVSAGVLQ